VRKKTNPKNSFVSLNNDEKSKHTDCFYIVLSKTFDFQSLFTESFVPSDYISTNYLNFYRMQPRIPVHIQTHKQDKPKISLL